MSLPPSDMSPTSLARVPGKPQKLLGGEFRVSSRDLLCGVSLPGGGATGVGVDERIEGASRRLPGFVLLDVKVWPGRRGGKPQPNPRGYRDPSTLMARDG